MADQLGLRGRLLREAGIAARLSGDLEAAVGLLTSASELLREGGLPRDAARAEALAAMLLWEAGHLEDAGPRLATAYVAVDDGSDDEAFADLAAQRASLAFMSGELDEALGFADAALRIADGLRLAPILVEALITKANVLAEGGRPVEAEALWTHAVHVALEQDLAGSAMRGFYNLADSKMAAGRFAEAEELLDRGLTLARQRGDRQGERRLQAASLTALVATGRWDEAIAQTGILSDHADDVWTAQALMTMPYVLAPRGDQSGLERIFDQQARTTDWPTVGATDVARAVILRERGDVEEAAGRASEGVLKFIGSSVCELPLAFGEAVETAFSAGKPETVEMLLGRVDQLRPAQVAPMLDAEVTRARARLAAHRGDVAAADRWFRRALGLCQELGTPFLLARVQLQYAEILADAKSDADQARALRDAAAAAFEALDAAPWLARARALKAPSPRRSELTPLRF